MSTSFYFEGVLVESVEGILSESEAFLRVARLSYDLGCRLGDISWGVEDCLACVLD